MHSWMAKANLGIAVRHRVKEAKRPRGHIEGLGGGEPWSSGMPGCFQDVGHLRKELREGYWTLPQLRKILQRLEKGPGDHPGAALLKEVELFCRKVLLGIAAEADDVPKGVERVGLLNPTL